MKGDGQRWMNIHTKIPTLPFFFHYPPHFQTGHAQTKTAESSNEPKKKQDNTWLLFIEKHRRKTAKDKKRM